MPAVKHVQRQGASHWQTFLDLKISYDGCVDAGDCSADGCECFYDSGGGVRMFFDCVNVVDSVIGKSD